MRRIFRSTKVMLAALVVAMFLALGSVQPLRADDCSDCRDEALQWYESTYWVVYGATGNHQQAVQAGQEAYCGYIAENCSPCWTLCAVE